MNDSDGHLRNTITRSQFLLKLRRSLNLNTSRTEETAVHLVHILLTYETRMDMEEGTSVPL